MQQLVWGCQNIGKDWLGACHSQLDPGFPTAPSAILSRFASDHFPILITTDGPCNPRPPFQFEKFWIFYSRSWNLIKVVWRLSIHEDARYRITQRLELARQMRLRWNRLEVSDIFRWINEVEVEIVDIQKPEDHEGVSMRLTLGYSTTTSHHTTPYWGNRRIYRNIIQGFNGSRSMTRISNSFISLL